MLESRKQVPLGGSNIFHTDNWTTEVTEIIAPLIVGFDNKPTQTAYEPIEENKHNNKNVNKNKYIVYKKQIV